MAGAQPKAQFQLAWLAVRRWWLPALLVLLALGGLGAAYYRRQAADTDLRRMMLSQAIAIANAVDPELAKCLTFTAADKDNPCFQRLRFQLTAYAQALGHRSVYSMAVRQGNMVFGPESLAEDDPLASPPGTVYQKPSDGDWAVFEAGRPYVGGPVSDEYGTFISAVAPVCDPHTGEVLMAIGLDIEVRDWARRLAGAYVPPVIGVAALIVFLLAWRYAIQRQNRSPTWQGERLRNSEVYLTLAFGLLLTTAVASLAYEAELRSTRMVFKQIAEAEQELASDAFASVRYALLNLAHFFEASEQVTPHEFEVFARPLLNSTPAQSYGWLPRISASERAAFEAKVRRDGQPGFVISEPGAPGQRTPAGDRDVYYPLLYVEPHARYESSLGYDHGAEPVLRVALDEAAQMGLPTVTEPITVTQDGIDQPGLLVYQPVYRAEALQFATPAERATERSVAGFVSAVIPLQALLSEVGVETHHNSSPVYMCLFALEPNAPPRWLATSQPGHTELNRSLPNLAHGEELGLSAVYPLFRFGQAYALAVHPGTEETFLAMNPRSTALAVGLAGVVLTLLLTLFIAFLNQARFNLEREVQARTEDLRFSESRYRTFVNATQDLVFLKDDQFRYIMFNDAQVRFFNKTAEEIEGKTDFDLMPPQMAQACRQSDQQALEQNGVVVTIEPVGDRIYETQKFPVPLPDGKTGVGAFIRDVTEAKRAEEEKEQLHARLAQAQKMEAIGRLAGGVAHDFNNMLTVILGYAHSALDTLAPTDPLRHDIREIEQAARRSADLTRQLLAFSRKQMVTPRVINLNEAIAERQKMLARLIGEDIRFEFHPAESLWNVRIDPSQIDQILANLTANARDAIRGVGAVIVETDNAPAYQPRDPDIPPGDYVMLAFSDSGVGMDKETLEHIFEPFFTTKSVGEGTGLGLATVYGIVKQNEGDIRVYSEPGHGATFKIYLPRFLGQAEPDSPTSPTPPRGGGETILVVEDEVQILDLVRRLLERNGYTVLTAETPHKACELMQQYSGPIDLLLTDVIMPAMNGKELQARIRQRSPNIKTLFMSGYPQDVIAQRGLIDAGAGYIQKPFALDALCRKVRDVLDSSGKHV